MAKKEWEQIIDEANIIAEELTEVVDKVVQKHMENGKSAEMLTALLIFSHKLAEWDDNISKLREGKEKNER